MSKQKQDWPISKMQSTFRTLVKSSIVYYWDKYLDQVSEYILGLKLCIFYKKLTFWSLKYIFAHTLRQIFPLSNE